MMSKNRVHLQIQIRYWSRLADLIFDPTPAFWFSQ